MDFLPSAKARLIIRFEEFGQGLPDDATPSKPMSLKRGLKLVDGPNLQVGPDPDAPSGVSRYLIGPPQQSPKHGGPQGQDKSTDLLTHAVVVPVRKATWSQNGVRTADTLQMTIRYLDLPLDPRLIRAMGIEYYLGTVSEEDYASGQEGATRGNGEPLWMVPDKYVDKAGNERTNLRFQGWADHVKSRFPNDGEATLEFDCRDNTQLFIDTEAPPQLALDVGVQIDLAVANYLANFRAFQGLSVEYRQGKTSMGPWTVGAVPVLKDVLAKTAYPRELGPPPGRAGGAVGTGVKASVWDYLTDVVSSIGHTIRVDGTLLVIQTMSNLLSELRRRVDDPFQGRRVGQSSFDYRRFILGSNIEDLEMDRNFTSHGGPVNVEVRSYSPRRKKTLVARFPTKASGKRAVAARPGDQTGENKWMVYKVTGIEDDAMLRDIARNVYYAQGKGEIVALCRTRDVSSFGGDGLDPEVLDMKVGDVFEPLVRAADPDGDDGSSFARVEQELDGVARAKRWMQDRGFSGELADAYAKAYNDANFTTQFRFKAGTFEFSVDDGVRLTLVGGNYVQVREDPDVTGTAI